MHEAWKHIRAILLLPGVVTVNLTFIPLFEEPSLSKRFGADYEEYRRNVPRWIPRLRRWVREANQFRH